MAQVIRTLGLTLALVATVGGWVQAQPAIPDTGLAAEAAGRWVEAVGIYREILQRDPERADLWVRVSDIEAFLGNVPESVVALEQATAADPRNAGLHQRLSQAYAANEQVIPAVEAIEVALDLEPRNVDYLRAHATLTTWAGRYASAASSYDRIDDLEPDPENTLALARVSAWSGDTDEAVDAYRRYLSTQDDAADVWLELAVAEYWRGNYGASHDVLQHHAERFGVTRAQRQQLAAVFSQAGKPARALEILESLLAEEPDSYDLNFIRTVAFAMQPRPTEAFDSLDVIRTIDPVEARSDTAARLLRTTLGSMVGPEFSIYSDSDKLEITRYAAEAEVSFGSGTDLRAGFERHQLDSRVGSGLEQLSGSSDADHEHGWLGVGQRIRAVGVEGRIGRAVAEGRELTTYALGIEARPDDALTFRIGRQLEYFVISPRTVGLGVERLSHQASLEWTPGLRNYIGLTGAYHELSDGNELLEFTFSPRRHLVRNEWMNLDVGFSAYQYRARFDLGTGYYDPQKYEFYGAGVYPYWKANEDVGLSITVVAGVQRDDESPRFSAAGNAAVRGIFGIYGPVVLNVSAAATFNRRLESGAFRGLRGGVALAVRF